MMNRLFRMVEILLMAVLLSACSCSDDEALAIQHALAVYDSHPDSALAILRTIDRSELSGKNLATYSLAYSMAQDKSGLDVTSDSLLRIAYDYFCDCPNDSLYAKCMYYMGNYYGMVDSIKRAETCYNQAIRYADKYHDYKISYMSREMLARSLYHSEPDEALKLAQEERTIVERHDAGNYRNRIHALLTIAEICMEQGDYGQSIDLQRKALAMAEKQSDASMIKYVCQDIATTYLDEGKPDSAMLAVSHAMAVYGQHDLQLSFLHAVALCEMDSLNRGSEELQELLLHDLSLDMECVAYRHLRDAAFARKDMIHARMYTDSASSCEDKFYQESLKLRFDYYQEALHKEQESNENARAAEIRTLQLKLAVLAAFVVIILLYILYIMRRRDIIRQNELEQRKQHLEAEMREKSLQQELSIREMRIDLMRNYLLQKTSVMAHIEKSRKQDSAVFLDDKDWGDLEILLNGVDDLFVKRLSEAFPQMSLKDIRFCMLLRLGLSTKDLTNIYMINERSIKQKMYLFKSKLKISTPETSLRQFIQSF